MIVSSVLALARDVVFIFLLFLETSFTGSAGTTYNFLGVPYGAVVYFVWITINMIISFIYTESKPYLLIK